MRRLREYAAAASQGSKEDVEAANQILRDFHDLLAGDSPDMDDPEHFRERWGTTDRAQQGQAAMLSMPGLAGFVLDDEPGPA